MIELMVVVAVAAILASVVAPPVAAFATARRVEDVARRLNESIAQGRMEAVKRNAPVLLCADASVTDGSCNQTPTTADWAKGWRLCYDLDANGLCDPGNAANPNPVRLQAAINDTVTLTGPATHMRFNPDGSVTAANFTDFDFHPVSAPSTRWIVKFAASGASSVRKG